MKKLTSGQKLSVLYHDLFDYPLTEEEMGKWHGRAYHRHSGPQVIEKQGYYMLKGREGIIKQRKANQIASKKKLKIAENASLVLAHVPTVNMVAISGALAMNNASVHADIDLLIVTSANSLWLTRPLVYFLLKLSKFKVRQPNDPDEKDKLCLNLWMDESDLKIKEKNIYTAHELAQLVPLVNKNNTYEKLMSENKWLNEYWPSAVAKKYAISKRKTGNNQMLGAFNRAAFNIQYQHMKAKMTREQVSLTRAFFHPKDWGEEVEKRLGEN